VENLVPLSAISFCSAPLYKKDVAAIGAILEGLVALFHFEVRPCDHLQFNRNLFKKLGDIFIFVDITQSIANISKFSASRIKNTLSQQ